jgi:Pentapeptide repeats (8 copies)
VRNPEIRPDLSRADLADVNLAGANLGGAYLRLANLRKTNLSGAVLVGVDLRRAYFRRANLSGADLGGAILERTTLIETDLRNANLSNCRIHGISAWDLKLEGARQDNLVITPRRDQRKITVDNLEIAQFIYLLLNNERVRHVIDTITSKVVLILGRFTPERKVVLDASGRNCDSATTFLCSSTSTSQRART